MDWEDQLTIIERPTFRVGGKYLTLLELLLLEEGLLKLWQQYCPDRVRAAWPQFDPIKHEVILVGIRVG